MPRTILNFTILTILLLVISSSTPLQQDTWSWPEETKNLQVLPQEWTGARLRPVMTGFTRALGVRCSHCHVGKEGEPLSTYDFISDENPNKNRAREMLRMLGSINNHLKKIEPSGDKAVNMWCHTCHRGRPRPMTVKEEIGEKYRRQGLDQALEHYNNLKNNWFGKGAYSFNENNLNEFGYEVLGDGDTAGAIKVFTLNTEQYPESANVWDSLAEGHMKAGQHDQAIEYYEKSLSLNPYNQNARDMIKKMKQE